MPEAMQTIRVTCEPRQPYRPGTARERAWHILKAFDGCSVHDVVDAWQASRQWEEDVLAYLREG